MQGGENHAENDEEDHHTAHQYQWLAPLEVLENDGRELQGKHGGVEHDAPGDLEHHRVRIAHDERMPNVPGQTEVVHERGTHQQVAHEGGEDSGPQNRVPAFDVEDLYGSSQGEAARRQHDAAHDIEANPDAPGEVVA